MMVARQMNQFFAWGDLVDKSVPLSAADARIRVSAISLDSRKASEGCLFIALSGSRCHGLEYLRQVIDAGCVAILAEVDERWSAAAITALSADVAVIPVPGLSHQVGAVAARFYGNPAHDIDVIGITGTNGKSSCAWLLSHALGRNGRCAMIGTLGNGFPDALNTATHTTPDAISLQQMLAEYVDQGASAVAMEISSHALHQGRVAGLDVDVAVFTNLSRDHLDYHGSMEAYGEAKQQLFISHSLKCAVINMDDPFGEKLLAELPQGVKSIAFSSHQKEINADIVLRAVEILQLAEGLEVTVECDAHHARLRSPLIGYFNVENLLAVCGALMGTGLSFRDAVTAVSGVLPVPGRMERFGGHGLPAVIVDYAHTPDALKSALLASRAHTAGKLITVFGCGGERDRGKRPMMGRVAETHADEVLLTNDNPRSEDPLTIIDEILSGMEEPQRAVIETDRAAAIRSAIGRAGAGDIVLIAGKGHEEYQIIGDERRYFSDQDVVRKALLEATP